MKPGGRDEANWGTADGKRHTLVASLAILETPVVKKHVVCAQVHHPDDDLLMVRLEGKKLFVERNDLPGVRLDSNYKLGTRFSIKIEAEGGHVKVWYNDQLKMDWVVSQQGCYFKAGCYTQSNTTKGDLPTAGGEVAIYRLVVFHQ
jgi:poly(beta-D-mannuronate) lyase